MLTLIDLKQCLGMLLSETKIKYLLDIFSSFFQVSYAASTRSRYSLYSLRSHFRFLSSVYDWVSVRVRLFERFSFVKTATYIVVADETVEGKSRDKTFGLDKFYSSTAGKPIAGVCFFGLSLVHVQSGLSSFMGVLQVVYSLADKVRIAVAKEKKEMAKKRTLAAESLPKGRKKGSKNKPKQENETASYRRFKLLFINVLDVLLKVCVGINVRYLVVDIAYGTLDYATLAESKNLFLLSKFKSNVALYLPYQGEQKRGRPTLYGAQVKPTDLPEKFLKETLTKDGYTKKYYQFEAFAKNAFGARRLTIVVQRTRRLKDGRTATNIWFSNDTEINYQTLLHYYHLRFQIEFDFRDAKQHFGLSDFKNYKEENVGNFVNLSFTM